MSDILTSINSAIIEYRQFYGRKPTAILMGSWPETELRRLALEKFEIIDDPEGGHGGSFKIGHRNCIMGIPIVPVGTWSTGVILI